MEVCGLISLDSGLKDRFKEFLDSQSDLGDISEDDDAIYYYDLADQRLAYILDKLHTDIQYEFRVNLSEEEKDYIVNYFGTENIYSFDIQFKYLNRFPNMLSKFKQTLIEEGTLTPILINDPFDRLKHF